jgi:hypothetical protein
VGWNDRLPTDPYLPRDEYYNNGEEEYHAWLEYVEMRLNEEGLTSQNIDPANLPTAPQQEPGGRQNILSILRTIVFGQNVSKIEKQKSQRNSQEENAEVPF